MVLWEDGRHWESWRLPEVRAKGGPETERERPQLSWKGESSPYIEWLNQGCLLSWAWPYVWGLVAQAPRFDTHLPSAAVSDLGDCIGRLHGAGTVSFTGWIRGVAIRISFYTKSSSCNNENKDIPLKLLQGHHEAIAKCNWQIYTIINYSKL